MTAESGGEPYEGQVAVAATVLNRVQSGAYPTTIPGVIYQVVDGKYYQFSPVLDGRINTTPSSSALRAAQAAMNGWDPSYGALGFYNPAKTSNYWVQLRPVTRVIGGHVFFNRSVRQSPGRQARQLPEALPRGCSCADPIDV